MLTNQKLRLIPRDTCRAFTNSISLCFRPWKERLCDPVHLTLITRDVLVSFHKYPEEGTSSPWQPDRCVPTTNSNFTINWESEFAGEQAHVTWPMASDLTMHQGVCVSTGTGGSNSLIAVFACLFVCVIVFFMYLCASVLVGLWIYVNACDVGQYLYHMFVCLCVCVLVCLCVFVFVCVCLWRRGMGSSEYAIL